MPYYVDGFEMSEDSRIEVIGKAVEAGQTVAVVLERDNAAKIERYIRKVLSRYPVAAVLKRFNGPTSKAITVKFGPKPN